MINKNYHTHTTYCDGKDSVREMILSAIDKGFDVIGFSGHSPLFDDWCMTQDGMLEYIRDVNSNKELYKDKIEILCGIEQDYFSTNKTDKFDFVIGSVHCVDVSGTLLCVDETAEILKNGIDRYFGGDPIKLAQKYYELVGDVADKTGCDIVGHLDLITKFQDISPIFDTSDKRYIRAAESAIKKLSAKNVMFEVNTGAMSRGLKKSPYPQQELLSYIGDCGCDVVLSSDCHSKEHIDFGFDEAIKLIKDCGFKRVAYLSNGKRKYMSI